jgi:hypothetical protein
MENELAPFKRALKEAERKASLKTNRAHRMAILKSYQAEARVFFDAIRKTMK